MNFFLLVLTCGTCSACGAPLEYISHWNGSAMLCTLSLDCSLSLMETDGVNRSMCTPWVPFLLTSTPNGHGIVVFCFLFRGLVFLAGCKSFIPSLRQLW